MPPRPCSIRSVGNGPSPVAGNVTSTSSGVPSKLAHAGRQVGRRAEAHAVLRRARVAERRGRRLGGPGSEPGEGRDRGERRGAAGGWHPGNLPGRTGHRAAAAMRTPGRAIPSRAVSGSPSVIVLVDVDDFDAVLAGEAGALTARLARVPHAGPLRAWLHRTAARLGAPWHREGGGGERRPVVLVEAAAST